jgi:hypothetical protein
MPVMGPVPEIVQPNVEQAAPPSLAEQRHIQRREVLRKYRDNVDTHGLLGSVS